MDMAGLTCHGCGSTNVIFDPRTRVLNCNQCGNRQTYSRATLNKNGKVVFCKQNAMNFFMTGQFDNARHYAMDVLNISMDNVAALFMIAYHDEFCLHRYGAVGEFFGQADAVALEYDEIVDMEKLIVATAVRLMEYEKDIIQLFAKNMQTEDTNEDLCRIIDKVCPYFIANRTSSDFFDQDLIDMYKELAGHCSIPKTCFALLKGIENNPDSPYLDKSFYLRGKTQYFYEHYVLPVGDIINEITEVNFKNKFLSVYQAKVSEYRNVII